MNLIISENFFHFKEKLIRVIENFDNEGILIGEGRRNTIKHTVINDIHVNFKAFKKPNPINRIVYKCFRKSKARRSFEYANLLISKKINTPQPIAYIENYNLLGLTSSFYICEHLTNVFTFREVLNNLNFTDREVLIKAYTNFIYQLHEIGIEFIDNTSANFLIKKDNNVYKFFLVDLNRMNFHDVMKTKKRLNNLSRLTNDFDVIHIISIEYARLIGISSEYCSKKIMCASLHHKFKYKLKNKLKFYKHLKFNEIAKKFIKIQQSTS